MVNKLNNMFLTGQNHYPTTVEAVMTMLSHYMDNKLQVYRSVTKEMGVSAMSFAQQRKKNVTCYKCGKKGHYTNDCDEDSDDELTSGLTIMSVASRQTGHTSWSG